MNDENNGRTNGTSGERISGDMRTVVPTWRLSEMMAASNMRMNGGSACVRVVTLTGKVPNVPAPIGDDSAPMWGAALRLVKSGKATWRPLETVEGLFAGLAEDTRRHLPMDDICDEPTYDYKLRFRPA